MDNHTSETPLKRCCHCLEDFPATPEFFYRSSSKADGLYHQCKTCKEAYRKTPKGRDVVRRRTSKWRKTENGKKYRRAKDKRRRERFPEKGKARSAVRTAIKSEKLVAVELCSCAKCGSQSEEYHHYSYEREHWLDVIPLCRPCHRSIHRMNKKRRAIVELQLRQLKRAA